jgi:hypothetical protein
MKLLIVRLSVSSCEGNTEETIEGNRGTKGTEEKNNARKKGGQEMKIQKG